MDRRRFLKNSLAAAVAPAAISFKSGAVRGQTNWPARDVTMVVPFPPGGQADFAARPVAAALQKILGKNFVVENRAGGAGGSVGNAIVARAAPDGYTLLMALSSLAVLPEADEVVRTRAGLRGIAVLSARESWRIQLCLQYRPSAPWHSIQEFVRRCQKAAWRYRIRIVRPLWHAACCHGNVCFFRNPALARLAFSRIRGEPAIVRWGSSLRSAVHGSLQFLHRGFFRRH